MSLLIVEDSAVIRQSLREMIAEIPGIKVVGEAGDAVVGENLIHSLKLGGMLMLGKTDALALKMSRGFDIVNSLERIFRKRVAQTSCLT